VLEPKGVYPHQTRSKRGRVGEDVPQRSSDDLTPRRPFCASLSPAASRGLARWKSVRAEKLPSKVLRCVRAKVWRAAVEWMADECSPLVCANIPASRATGRGTPRQTSARTHPDVDRLAFGPGQPFQRGKSRLAAADLKSAKRSAWKVRIVARGLRQHLANLPRFERVGVITPLDRRQRAPL